MTPDTAPQSGPFGRGGGTSVRVQMQFHGQFTEDFAAFVQTRAVRLSVHVIIEQTPTRVTVLAEGADAMVGALEMASCIGPENCRVTAWDVTDWTGDRR